MQDVIGILVFLPVVAVWFLAMYDVLTRKDLGRRRRIITAVGVGLFFPITLLYLLARPPSSVRRGPEAEGDPRTPMIRRLESGERSDRDGEWAEWVGEAVAGSAPRTR